MKKPFSRAINPSRAYLPKLSSPPATILEYLYQRFPHLTATQLNARVANGDICFANGTTITSSTPYQYGETIFYYREVAQEPIIPFTEKILFQDEEILVADKPHFLPVTPSGSCVQECLLARLQQQTGITTLTPVHRLDRDTAGLVVFSIRKATRHLYHQLFEQAKITKEYLAIASINSPLRQQEWLLTNRIEAGEPWFTMKVTAGVANATTKIVLIEQRANQGLFQLLPQTGKKHQLRVHLNHLGYPIINDPYYPTVTQAVSSETTLPNYDRPLQLLAQRLAFIDPITGNLREWHSQQHLEW